MDLTHFSRWLEAQGTTDPTTLKGVDIKAFLSYLRTQPNGRGKTLSPKSIYNARAALRSFYRWLQEETGCPNVLTL